MLLCNLTRRLIDEKKKLGDYYVANFRVNAWIYMGHDAHESETTMLQNKIVTIKGSPTLFALLHGVERLRKSSEFSISFLRLTKNEDMVKENNFAAFDLWVGECIYSERERERNVSKIFATCKWNWVDWIFLKPV